MEKTLTRKTMKDLITFLIDLFSFDKEHPLLFTQFNFWAFFLIVFAGFCLLIAARYQC